MSLRTEDRRRNWLPLGLAFLLGLFIGWWVIGWWLWPVTYTNSLLTDLRPEEKGQYLLMVADSYASTNDLGTAQTRTNAWSKEQLATDLGTLQSRLAQANPVQAEHVQRLAAAMNLPRSSAPVPAVQPAPAQTESPNFFQRVCPGLLWVLLALAGIAAILWLWSQWQRRSARPKPRSAPVSSATYQPTPTISPAAQMAGEQEDAPWENEALGQADLPWEEVDKDADVYPASVDREPQSAATSTSARNPRDAGTPDATSASRPDALPAVEPAAPTQNPPRLVKVGEFLAAYHADEPDYDEGFDIKDTTGAVVAMCGLGLMSPVGRGNDQAAALQVWLWEKSDQFTQVKVLMSENAYKDTSQRDQLAEDYPPLPVRQGTEFDMETHGFVLHGIVEKILYEENDSNRIFNHLAVRMRVFEKERS